MEFVAQNQKGNHKILLVNFTNRNCMVIAANSLSLNASNIKFMPKYVLFRVFVILFLHALS